jgi:hypothetical protein
MRIYWSLSIILKFKSWNKRRYPPMTVKMRKGFKAMTSTKSKNARPNAMSA